MNRLDIYPRFILQNVVKIVKRNTDKIWKSLRRKKCCRTSRASIFIFVGVGGRQVHVSLPGNFLWTHGKIFTVICLPVASTEAVNKSVGKGKKVNTTKGDKKLQQPEQEVGSTERFILSHWCCCWCWWWWWTFCFTVKFLVLTLGDERVNHFILKNSPKYGSGTPIFTCLQYCTTSTCFKKFCGF